MDTLTLKAGGIELVLFAPRPVQGGLEAHAFMNSAPTARPRTFTDEQNRKYRAARLPKRGLHLARIVITEAQK